MRKLLTVAMVAAVVALCSSANAGQIWTDGNGDGLPDGGPAIAASPSTNVTVGVWFDAQAFAFTNFLAYIEWQGQCVSYVSASYVITGGSNFPIDNFSAPNAIGFGGSGFANRTGVIQVGNAVFHINTTTACCISPIIDIYNPYYVFSQLGAGSAYMLFTTNPGTCYGEAAPPTGACCFPDFSCQILSASACATGGGNYLGDGTLCTQCPTPPQREACCFPDGSCVEANVGECPAGSVGQGVGTSCSPNLCQDIRPREACCFPDGSCVVALSGQCPAGSVGQGDGTNCDPNLCPPPPGSGACCFSDFSCQILTAAACETAGGQYQGDGSDCSACPLPPETGACCLPNGGCLDGVTRDQCAASGGLFFPNTPCSQVTCTNAVESRSWGNIKGLYR